MRVAQGNLTDYYRFRDDVPFSEVWKIYAQQVLYARQMHRP